MQSTRLNAKKIKGKFYDYMTRDRRPLKMENKIVVATHHKTGTVWLLTLFKKIAIKHRLTLFKGLQKELPEQWDIFFQDHGQIDREALAEGYRGVHLIRDPRDVVVSGCFYHQKSNEGWLHIPRKEFEGRTYQESINRLDTLEDQILFEMDNAASRGIEDIMDWDYSDEKMLELKYEDLISDVDLEVFHRLFLHLGFSGAVIPGLLNIAFENSIFSGNLSDNPHVRSGGAKQWAQYFTPELKDAFHARFGECLVQLGYEDDNHW